MTVSVAVDNPPAPPGNVKECYGTVTFDSSYPAGGEAVTAAQFGLSELLDLVPQGVSTNGYSPRYDKANKKLLMFRTDQTDDPAEQVPNTTDLSAESVRVKALGW